MYTIDPGSDVLDEVRDIAHDQVTKAIADLEEPGDDLVGSVHDCRKRCKKLRGLVRLVRPALGDHYKTANSTFRDAARQLSGLRDAHALLATFDDLVETRHENVPPDRLGRVRTELATRSSRASEKADPSNPDIAESLELLDRGKAMVDGWDLDERGFDALAGGLAKTYERGRKALDRAISAPTSAAFHEYRKRAKYTWYHVRLLDEVAPSVSDPLERRLHDLSDTLGDEHDLAVLSDQIQDEPEAFGGPNETARALMVIDGQRADLQRRAIRLGARLHAEKPKAFTSRFEAYWDAWHDHGEELKAGEIAALKAV